MTPSLNQRSAARILDLADPAARPRRPQALAASALFLAISAFAAHEVVRVGSPASAQAAAMSPAGATHAHAESPEMKQLLSRLSVASAVAVGSSALAQDAVQWRVEDGGNGHWYAVHQQTSPLGWDAAMQFAQSIGGYLSTLASATEDSWVRTRVVTPMGIPPITSGPWLGATCEGTTWGNWRWVTGEPWVYSAWAGGEPNNGGGQEHYVQMYQGQNLSWNDNQLDGRGTTFSAIIEWSADCNADGIVDYGQILTGELEDTNANNIPDCCEAGTACGCSADISGNGTVDAVDLAAVLSSWGNAPTGKVNADVNRDGIVDAIDLAEVLGAWGACP
ncbi:MAG: dockerin type I domain-containing protein [Limnohabitans sp.]|nr:dockerin type I domain-containing protein [Limnohabitans sp.]MDI9403391.1 dockerin type I domain-containing protein [Limnohabitans sp.]